MKRSFFTLSALYFAGTKATGTNAYRLIGSVNNCLNLADVGLPGSVGLAVGVRHVVSKGYALTADAAFSHFDTSQNSVPRDLNFISFFINHKLTSSIISHSI